MLYEVITNRNVVSITGRPGTLEFEDGYQQMTGRARQFDVVGHAGRSKFGFRLLPAERLPVLGGDGDAREHLVQRFSGVQLSLQPAEQAAEFSYNFV